MRSAADNDILLKGACYGLLAEFAHALPGEGPIGILGTALYVVPKRISKKNLKRKREDAVSNFMAFVADNVVLEPTSEEQQFASKLEAAAQQKSLNLDAGESILVSIAAVRQLPLLLTGDKRAIISLEELLEIDERLEVLYRRVMCLEQLMLGAIRVGDPKMIRREICSEPEIDKALNMCFSCFSLGADHNPVPGLKNYISDLRKSATRILTA